MRKMRKSKKMKITKINRRRQCCTVQCTAVQYVLNKTNL